MAKCSDCREKEIELLTPFERFKDHIFHLFFSRDIQDLTQNKYSQGFGDGLQKGREMERKSVRELVKGMYNIEI